MRLLIEQSDFDYQIRYGEQDTYEWVDEDGQCEQYGGFVDGGVWIDILLLLLQLIFLQVMIIVLIAAVSYLIDDEYYRLVDYPLH